MKQRGFTVIELLIVIAIVGILAAVIFPAVTGPRDGTRCVSGFKFTDQYRHSVQVLDEQGHGIPCNRM